MPSGNDLIFRHAAIAAVTGHDNPTDLDLEYAINTLAAIKAEPAQFRSKNHKVLIVFMFNTGDRDFPVDCLYVVADGGTCRVDIEKLRSEMNDHIEDRRNEDYEYEDYVEDVMNESGYDWEWNLDSIPPCDDGIASISVE